jgi:hypothetical protein
VGKLLLVSAAMFNLAEDFDLACDLGYGQFIWQSANYLNVGDTDQWQIYEHSNPRMTTKNHRSFHERMNQTWPSA